MKKIDQHQTNLLGYYPVYPLFSVGLYALRNRSTPKEFVSRLNKFAHARTVEPIPIDLINQPEKWRRILEANVDIFAESMRQNGQLQPIGLVPAKEVGRYDIKWGEQRLLGAKKLNWTHIDAVVLRDVSKAEADLMTLDENIARNGYSCVLEEACARTQQKALYLQLHPETGRGGDRRSNRASNPNNSVLVEPFTAYVANETNQSSDRVEQLGQDWNITRTLCRHPVWYADRRLFYRACSLFLVVQKTSSLD